MVVVDRQTTAELITDSIIDAGWYQETVTAKLVTYGGTHSERQVLRPVRGEIQPNFVSADCDGYVNIFIVSSSCIRWCCRSRSFYWSKINHLSIALNTVSKMPLWLSEFIGTPVKVLSVIEYPHGILPGPWRIRDLNPIFEMVSNLWFCYEHYPKYQLTCITRYR